MNKKRWVVLVACITFLLLVFFQRYSLNVFYLAGQEVQFPNYTANKKGVRIFIVGSEETLSAKLVEQVSKNCTNISISTKVNRFTDFDWQEKDELHRYIRIGEYNVVLIETSSIDFLKENVDRIARFEASARKADSKIFYWGPQLQDRDQNGTIRYPDNFIPDLGINITPLCAILAR